MTAVVCCQEKKFDFNYVADLDSNWSKMEKKKRDQDVGLSYLPHLSFLFYFRRQEHKTVETTGSRISRKTVLKFQCRETVAETDIHQVTIYYYRPRSEGDNVIGSVRPSVRPFVEMCVCLSELSCLNRLTFDLDVWHGGRP